MWVGILCFACDFLWFVADLDWLRLGGLRGLGYGDGWLLGWLLVCCVVLV